MKKLLKKITSKRLFTILSVILILGAMTFSTSAYVYHSTDYQVLAKSAILPLDYATFDFITNGSSPDEYLWQLTSDFLFSYQTQTSATGTLRWDDDDYCDWAYTIDYANRNIIRDYKFYFYHAMLSDLSQITLYSDECIISSEVYNSGAYAYFSLNDNYQASSCKIYGFFNKPILDVEVDYQGEYANVQSQIEYEEVFFEYDIEMDSSGVYTFPIDSLFSSGVNYLIGTQTKYLLISDLRVEFNNIVNFSDDNVCEIYVDSYVDTSAGNTWSDVLGHSDTFKTTSIRTTSSDLNFGSIILNTANAFLEPDIFGFFGIGDILGMVLVILVIIAIMKLIAGG